MTTHKLTMTSDRALFLLTFKHPEVRYWFSSFGDLVGVWVARNGRQYAIGRNPKGQTIAYRTADRMAA